MPSESTFNLLTKAIEELTKQNLKLAELQLGQSEIIESLQNEIKDLHFKCHILAESRLEHSEFMN